MRDRAFFSGPQGKEATRPAFPNLLAQQTKAFKAGPKPAAFPSLPLTGNPIRVSDEIRQSPDKSQSFYTERDFQEKAEVAAQETSSPVSWSSLELSCQHFIFTGLLKLQIDKSLVAIRLGLNYKELEEIEHAIYLKAIYPATVEEIWSYCIASDSVGSTAMAPDTLDKYLGYLVFAGGYEEVTCAGLHNVREFLRQHGLDIVLSNAFASRFHEPLDQTAQHPDLDKSYDKIQKDVPGQETQSQLHYGALPARSTPAKSLKRRTSMTSFHGSDDTVEDSTTSPFKQPQSSSTYHSTHLDIDPILRAQSSVPHKRRCVETQNSTSRLSVPCAEYSLTVSAPSSNARLQTSRRSTVSDLILSTGSNLSSGIQSPKLSPILSLTVDQDTGHASVSGDRLTPPLTRPSLAKSSDTHPYHKPTAFAPHFTCASFPSVVRQKLLAINPGELDTTSFWLIYGDGVIQHQLNGSMGFQTPGNGVYEPRKILLDERNVKDQALRALVKLHNDWVRGGYWQPIPERPDPIGRFERTSITILDNIQTARIVGPRPPRKVEDTGSQARKLPYSLDPDKTWDKPRSGVVNQQNHGIHTSYAMHKGEIMGRTPNYELTTPVPQASSLLEPVPVVVVNQATSPIPSTSAESYNPGVGGCLGLVSATSGAPVAVSHKLKPQPPAQRASNSRGPSLRITIPLPDSDLQPATTSKQHRAVYKNTSSSETRRSPERPSFSPISDFGDVLTDLMNPHAVHDDMEAEKAATAPISPVRLNAPTAGNLIAGSLESSQTSTDDSQLAQIAQMAWALSKTPAKKNPAKTKNAKTSGSNPSTPKTQRSDAGKKRGPYKKTLAKRASAAE